jgi:hypothetical protein
MSIQAGGGNIPQQTFEQFNDPNGNKLIALNRDGTILTQGVTFADGTKQISANVFISGTIQTSTGSFPASLIGDGVTDNTATINAALQIIFNAGGGTLVFPVGTFLVLGQINIPNDGKSVFNNSPMQPSIRITGSAASGALVPGGGGTPVPFGSGPADGGSVLNLTFNSATAKICTFGTGALEIDHLTLADTGTDSATFFFTSNTTVHIHDVTFLGTHVGAAAVNDALWFGNNNTTASGVFNAPFQGYGSIVNHCYFQNIKRALFGQAFANSIMFSENTIWSSSGNPTGGAIELGSALGQANANNITNNLFETLFYMYGIRIINGLNNKIENNDCWDGGAGTFQAAVRCEQNASSNFIIGGTTLGGGTQPYLQDANVGSLTNTYIGGMFGQANIFSNPTGVQLKATAALTPGQVVKLDTANTNSVIVATTTDTGAGLAIGIVANTPAAGAIANVVTIGKIVSTQAFAPKLGTGTATLGQFVIVDTTTNGRVMCTSTYTAGTVIGTVIGAQASVGSPVGVLLGLR